MRGAHQLSRMTAVLMLQLFVFTLACLVPCKADDLHGDRGIPFQFSDQIAGYEISGVWFPSERLSDLGELAGPVVFRLRHKVTGKISVVSENSVSIIDERFWQNAGIEPTLEDEQDYRRLLEQLKSLGILKLPYSEADRAKVRTCEKSSEKCLVLGQIPIDLQDLDFDGDADVVIMQKRAGQRGVDVYRIKSCDSCSDGEFNYFPYNDNGGTPPLSLIDSLSQINVTSREITIYYSAGVCLGMSETYKRFENAMHSFRKASSEVWDRGNDGNSCFRSIYKVTQNAAGFDVHKLISRQPESK
jgi:hypothetical protein